jgi:hypothetical protein
MQVFQLQEERKLSARDKSLDPRVRFLSKIRLISIIAASLEKTEYPAGTILSDFAQATPPNGDLKAFSRQWQAIFQLPQWLRDLVDELLMTQKDTIDKTYTGHSALKANLAN